MGRKREERGKKSGKCLKGFSRVIIVFISMFSGICQVTFKNNFPFATSLSSFCLDFTLASISAFFSLSSLGFSLTPGPAVHHVGHCRQAHPGALLFSGFSHNPIIFVDLLSFSFSSHPFLFMFSLVLSVSVCYSCVLSIFFCFVLLCFVFSLCSPFLSVALFSSVRSLILFRPSSFFISIILFPMFPFCFLFLSSFYRFLYLSLGYHLFSLKVRSLMPFFLFFLIIVQSSRRLGSEQTPLGGDRHGCAPQSRRSPS